MDFQVLLSGLKAEAERGNIVAKAKPGTDLVLFNYTNSCTFDRAWNDFTRMARGLILDTKLQRIAATPFPKFFNVFEENVPLPDVGFETFEKVDGSLGIVYHHASRWRVATRGSFDSVQAQWAERWLNSQPNISDLWQGTTYLVEIVYPQNRIVVDYGGWEGLILLGAYDHTGHEVPFSRLLDVRVPGIRHVESFHYNSVDAIVEIAKCLPARHEGFVVRFSNGYRVKIKGDEYIRIHRIISNLTPLSIWESMREGDDLKVIKSQLPEEFWKDFDNIVGLLSVDLNSLQCDIASAVMETEHMSDKELGLRLGEFDPKVQQFLFTLRRNPTAIFDLGSRMRRKYFDLVRPTGNRLEGYSPTTSMMNFRAEDV